MMPVNYIIALAALVFGSVQDIRKKEVSDWLNFSLIAVGIGFGVLASLVRQDWNIFLGSLIGLVIGVALGFAMYYTGQWGGGDSKMVMGLGALLGLNFWNGEWFFLTFLANSFLVGAVYGISWSVFLAVKNRKAFMHELRDVAYTKKALRIRFVLMALFVLLLVAIFIFSPAEIKHLMLIFLAFLFFSFYLLIFIKIVDKTCILKYVPVSRLTEGDWIAEDVFVKGKKVCGPKDLGISKEQIALLKRYQAQGLVSKIKIKDGIPFVPSFLLSFVVTYFWGNWWVGLL